jgi:MYXO-CTERM domain-containing protein
MNCLPKLVDCASGQACPAGWSCFDFSNLGGIPPAWGSVASNQACLPAGIIFAAQGHAAGGSQVTESSGSNAGSSGTGSMALGPGNGTGGKVATATATATATTTATATGGFPGGAAPSPTNQAPPAQAAPTASADAGVAPAAMVQSSGCAYGGSDASQVNPWLALAMAGLVARLARRRNRAG